MRTLVLVAALLTGCGGLSSYGKVAVITEQSVTGGVKGLRAWSSTVKSECVKKNLQTEAERRDCVSRPNKAVDITTTITQSIKIAAEAFWRAYAIVEAKGKDATDADRQAVRDALGQMQAQAQKLAPYLRQIGAVP